MHYCILCRRYLNGALCCPGCGAYVHDITSAPAQPSLVPRTLTVTPEGYCAEQLPSTAVSLDRPHSTAASVGIGTSRHVAEDGSQLGPFCRDERTSPTPQRRGGRHRQLTWQKSRRLRALVSATAALIGGGLIIAAQSTSSSHAPVDEAVVPKLVDPAPAAMSTAGAASVQSNPDTTVHPGGSMSAQYTAATYTTDGRSPQPHTAGHATQSNPTSAVTPSATAPIPSGGTSTMSPSGSPPPSAQLSPTSTVAPPEPGCLPFVCAGSVQVTVELPIT
ncbi:SCO2400 family protein [Streptomyces humicola]|uniref:SCO2400 family protein n=1 Tax=Streptomyces humicola TaxID=2953240 RepID=UPI003FD8B21D